MRRLILVVLVAVVACELSESPTGPTDESAAVRPSYSFTGGSGKVLGSTNQGELIEIDLDAGTATLIGDAGIFDGDSVGWTDIAFDDSGTLFGLSRIFFESDFEVHLYTIDPSNGSVLSDVGSMGDRSFTDFDHDGTAFYGSGNEHGPGGCCGQLFTVDATDASVTWISEDTVGFGNNPFDTLQSPFDPIAKGGFAVHPITGDLWGIEAFQSQATVLYRIDPVTGLADSIMKVGPPEFGYDALHILDDGTFIAARGGPFSNDSVLWEIDPTPDSLGVVPIQLIPLTFDTAIVGNLNGLEATVAESQDSMVLTLTVDTTELHPTIRALTVNGESQAYRPGDEAHLTVELLSGPTPMNDVSVTFTAFPRPRTAGHLHYRTARSLTQFPRITAAAANDSLRNVVSALGHFRDGTSRLDSIDVLTDSVGIATAVFRAGHVAGIVDVVASYQKDSVTAITDTVALTIKVPALDGLSEAIADAYYVGGVGPTASPPVDSTHVQGDNWYVDGAIIPLLRSLTDSLNHRAGDTLFVQFNDASLPWGGAFTSSRARLDAIEGSDLVDDPFTDHQSHALGIDVDIALCYAKYRGNDGQVHRVSGSACVERDNDGEANVLLGIEYEYFMNKARAIGGHPRVHNANHYHLRFTGVAP